jgi:hypothetical protein
MSFWRSSCLRPLFWENGLKRLIKHEFQQFRPMFVILIFLKNNDADINQWNRYFLMPLFSNWDKMLNFPFCSFQPFHFISLHLSFCHWSAEQEAQTIPMATSISIKMMLCIFLILVYSLIHYLLIPIQIHWVSHHTRSTHITSLDQLVLHKKRRLVLCAPYNLGLCKWSPCLHVTNKCQDYQTTMPKWPRSFSTF